MTKKKMKTTKPSLEETSEVPPELSVAQVYEQQVQLVIDDCTGESLKLLEAKFQALDLPGDGRKFQPHTSEVSRSDLRNQFVRLARSWHIPPPRPPAAPMPEPLKTTAGLVRAGFYDAEKRRIG